MKLDDNNLPKRLYYPINELAKELDCSIAYILHLAATEIIIPSIYIPAGYSDLPKNPHVNLACDVDYENAMKAGRLSGEGWSIYGLRQHHDEGFGDVVSCNSFNGFFYFSGYELTDLEFNLEKDKFTLFGLDTLPDIESPYSNIITFHANFPVKYICIMHDQVERLSEKNKGHLKIEGESAKTAAKKGELIPQILRMIPELKDIDFETISISKAIAMVESVAAQKGIQLPDTHRQTWQKYLGR